jgi:hypothetical protein
VPRSGAAILLAATRAAALEPIGTCALWADLQGACSIFGLKNITCRALCECGKMSDDSHLRLFSAHSANTKRRNLSQDLRAQKRTRALNLRADHPRKCPEEAVLRCELPPEDAHFSDIGLNEHLSAVCVALGMTRPTPVQVSGSAASLLAQSRRACTAGHGDSSDVSNHLPFVVGWCYSCCTSW